MRLTKADGGRIAVSKFNNKLDGRGIMYTVPNLDGSIKNIMDSKLTERINKANKLYNVFFRYDAPQDMEKHFTELCKIASNSTKTDLVENLCKYKGYQREDGKFVSVKKCSYKVSGQKNIKDVLKNYVEQCMTDFWQEDSNKKAAMAVLECICQGYCFSDAIEKLGESENNILNTFMDACVEQGDKNAYVKNVSELEEMFTLIIKEIVSKCNVKAYYENDKEKIERNLQEQIEMLKNLKRVKKKSSKKFDNKIVTIDLSNYYYANTEEYRMNAILIRMRKSLKRGSNRQMAIMLLQAIAGNGTLKEFVEKLKRNNQLEDFKRFLFCVNKDYHRTNIVRSVKKMDLRVQVNQKQLNISSVNNSKKYILSKTLERYAASKKESDKVLIDLKELLFKYFGVENKYKDRIWSLPDTGEYFDDGFVPYNQNTENVNTLELLWQDERVSKGKDRVVKKRINYVNYGKYLSIIKNNTDEFEIYWVSFIKEYIENEYVDKKEILLERDCKKVEMMAKCWKHIIQFLCSKYIDLGKSVYHFVIPENITNSGSYSELKSDYAEGISSFALEIIKAEETKQREIAKATATAVSNYSRAVIDYNSSEFISGNQLEDILFIKEDTLKLILRKDCYRQLLRYYGGMSQNEELATIQDITGMKLVMEFRGHFNKIRNRSFHYMDGKEVPISGDYTKVLIKSDILAYKNVIRQHFYSNNVYEFYEENQIAEMVKSLYSDNRISESQIPAFRTVWKRKDMSVEIDIWNTFVWNKELKKDNSKKLRFESALYFILKEIYYRDFILRNETKKEFFNVVNSKVKIYGDKETYNKEYFNAGRSFQDFINKQNTDASFGTICQAIIQECNQQNTQGEETYKHFKIWLADCIREVFKRYISQKYSYLLKPSFFVRKGEPTYLDNVEINCISFTESEELMYEWYTLAHFISPRQLNLLVGELKDYVQYRQDIFRRSVYAGQYPDKKSEGIARNDMQLKVNDTIKIIKVLDFVRVVSGKVSNVFEDYYDSKESYAELVHNYIDFPIKSGKTYFEGLKDLCCKTFSGGRKIDIYADEENPKILRNVEISRMYAGGDCILNGYDKITVEEIAKYYENIEKTEKILSKGLCSNEDEQHLVKEQQDLKRRITLNEVTDFYSLTNDLLGNLISLSYLRERDYMYMLLGFYYMTLRSDDGWNGEIMNSVHDNKFNINGGFVLYQILSIFDFDIKLWFKKGSEWDYQTGRVGLKIGKFAKYHDESIKCAIRLFVNDEKYDKEIVEVRNYVDHSKYYVNYDRSLIGLYNEFYAKCFSYSDKLRKSVLFNFKTILEKYFVKYNVKFNGREFCINNNLYSEKFTYKLKNNEKVEIDARNENYLKVVKQMLEYRNV